MIFAATISRMSLLLLLVMSLFVISSETSNSILQFNECSEGSEGQMLQHYRQNGQLPDPLWKSILYADGVRDSLAIAGFGHSLDKLFEKLDRKIKAKHDARKKSQTIFKFLHKDVLKRYSESVRFRDLFLKNEYNCLTSTILFTIAADRYDIPYALKLTPTHIYIVSDPHGENVIVEMTDPKKGFDFVPRQKEYIQYLLDYKLITEQELQEAGPEAIYNEHIQGSVTVDRMALLAAEYNNIAISYLDELDYENALCYIKKALVFDDGHETYRYSYYLTLDVFLRQDLNAYSNYLDELEQGLFIAAADTVVAAGFWEYARYVFNDLVVRRQDFDQGLDLLNRLKLRIGSQAFYQPRIVDTERIILENRLAAKYRLGHYEEAFQFAGELYRAYPEIRIYKDRYVDVGLQYAQKYVREGQIDSLYTVMDSMLVECSEYAILRTQYVAMIWNSVIPSLQIGNDLKTTAGHLEKAYSIDNKNVQVRQALTHVYHELAMSQVRRQRLRTARRYVMKGLGLDPGNVTLKQDLNLIDDAILVERQSK